MHIPCAGCGQTGHSPMKLIAFPLIFAVSASVGWTVYQRSAEVEDAKPKAAKALVGVNAVAVSRRTMEDRIELVGNLEATATMEIRSNLSEYITKMPYDVGDFVEADTIVAELDDTQLREMSRQSEAAYNVAKALLASAQSKAEQADRRWQRMKSLLDRGVSTENEVEEADSARKVAAAEVDVETARVAEAKAAWDHSLLKLKQTKISAVREGFVAAKLQEAGDLARADTAILTLVDLSIVRTVVHVGEYDYARIREGQTATVIADALPDRSFTGKVTRKAPVLEARTRTAAVHIEVANPEFELKPGMHSHVELSVNRRESTASIPIASLVDIEEGRAVFVIKKGETQAERRTVKTGIRQADHVEVLSGVNPGEYVVTLGSHLIEVGQEVAPTFFDASHTASPAQAAAPQDDASDNVGG